MGRENNGWIRQEVKEISFYVIFGIIMAVVLPIFLGFVLQGFEESFVSGKPLEFGDILVTYMIYYIMITVGLIGLPVLKVREMILTNRGEDISRQSKPSLFSVAYLHDPEIDGALYNLFRSLGLRGEKNPMKFTLSMFRMFVLSTLVFGALGILQTINPAAQFVGIPQLPFQVTETVEVLFTAEPPAFAETTLMIFILSLFMGLNAYISSKFKLPKAIFWFISLVLIAPIIGLGWMGFHNIVYGNSDAALFATFIFGWIGSTITLLTGSWIPWYSWHFWNNIFAKLREVIPSNEDIIFVSIVVWFTIFVLWIFGEFIRRRYFKKREVSIVEPR